MAETRPDPADNDAMIPPKVVQAHDAVHASIGPVVVKQQLLRQRTYPAC